MSEPGLTAGGSLSQRRTFVRVVFKNVAGECASSCEVGQVWTDLALCRGAVDGVTRLARARLENWAPSGRVCSGGLHSWLLFSCQPGVKVSLGLNYGSLAHVGMRIAAQLVALARELAGRVGCEPDEVGVSRGSRRACRPGLESRSCG